jgi:hypothetical protein
MQASKTFMVRGLLAAALVAGLGLGSIGCSEETGVKKETKIETPGGTTTHTETDKVKTTGENPPVAPDTSKPSP